MHNRGTKQLMSQKFTEAFLSVMVGEEHVRNTYFEAVGVLNAKKLLIVGVMPHTFRDELDLHHSVLNFANACIAQISTLQKLTNLSKQEFPLEHDLLRKFRDRNHHVGYFRFQPTHVLDDDSKEFYVWPVLKRLDSVMEKYPEWCLRPSKLSLSALLETNLKYVVELTTSQMSFFRGYNLKFYEGDRLNQLLLGQKNRGDWEVS